jgi:hypothetical protein
MGRSAQSNRRTKISLDETPSRLAERQFTAFLGQPGENHSQSEREISAAGLAWISTEMDSANIIPSEAPFFGRFAPKPP